MATQLSRRWQDVSLQIEIRKNATNMRPDESSEQSTAAPTLNSDDLNTGATAIQDQPSKLPLLDIGSFLSDPNSPAAQQFVHDLRDACREPGFCYLQGHGIDPTIESAAAAAARRFFALPAAERAELEIANSAHFRGYTILGDERTQGISDWRDQLDVGPEDEAVKLGPTDPAWLQLRGPNQWPKNVPEMAPATLRWMAELEGLGVAITRALALGLGQPMAAFDQHVLPRPDVHVKIIRYPAQERGKDTGQGVGLHHDSGLLSFILQDDQGGLEVQTKDGMVPATPIPGTYVMNLGQMMQAASNGYLRATPHRVQSPPSGQQRLSLAYFFNPMLESVFAPVELPPALQAEMQAELKAGVEPLAAPLPDDPVFATFGENTLKIRLRAHPDVAAKHYANSHD